MKPEKGRSRIYQKPDGTWYVLDDQGLEREATEADWAQLGKVVGGYTTTQPSPRSVKV